MTASSSGPIHHNGSGGGTISPSSSPAVDDTQPLACLFQATETAQDETHIVYVMRVQRGHDPKYAWLARARYSDFLELHSSVLRPSGIELPPMPPKKTFGNTRPEFLQVRQAGLQELMTRALASHFLANTLAVKRLLDRDAYREDFREQALAQISMWLRSNSQQWQLVGETGSECGWRFRKQYFLVRSLTAPASDKFVLTWTEYGVDFALGKNLTTSSSDLRYLLQQLEQLQHNNAFETLVCHHEVSTGLVQVKRLDDKLVSLRDYICGLRSSATVALQTSFLKKYSLKTTSHQQQQPLFTLQHIRQLGRRLLDTLHFLHHVKGLHYGHLHSGNVLVDAAGPPFRTVRLADLSNALLGLPYYYRAELVERRRVNMVELADVYGFGRCLYEMCYSRAAGDALGTKTDFSDCPFREVQPVLEMILGEEALCRSGLPTLAQLLQLPLFNVDPAGGNGLVAAASSIEAAQMASNAGAKLFAASRARELVAGCRERIERRLQEEQREVYKMRKRSEAESRVLSEEETRKRRRRQKQRAEHDDATSSKSGSLDAFAAQLGGELNNVSFTSSNYSNS